MRDFSLHSSERIPSLRIDEVDLVHAARYRFAADYLAAKNYRFGLDLFCGSGYGTAILAEKLPSIVMGIDGSQEAVTEASKHIGLANALFAHKVFPFSLPARWADFVVSFESIANVEHVDGFARLITHTLAPGGTLIVSATNEDRLPLANNRSIWQNRLPLGNVKMLWHRRHFRPAEMTALFEGHGLACRQTFSSRFSVAKDGRAVGSNGFSPIGSELKGGSDGDEIVYIFEKSA
jgi:2-polyprenyl-3-methyl-5-hydroxy-6-metoxy-1,4-benzoquinol methylase